MADSTSNIVEIDIDPKAYMRLGIAFNHKRPEYNDFRELWNSNKFEMVVGENFIDLWQKQGFGKWPRLSPKYFDWKVKKGVPRNILGMSPGAMMVFTGNMYMAMITETPESKRDRSPLQMSWGLDLSASAFQTGATPYPVYTNTARPITMFSGENAEKVSDLMRDYIFDAFESAFGGGLFA